jgi:hypothetical protein
VTRVVAVVVEADVLVAAVDLALGVGHFGAFWCLPMWGFGGALVPSR